MKLNQLKYYSLLLQIILLSACAPQITPSATASEAPASPSLVPVNLAGPEMTVGSTWLYADGTLLVAVPAGIFIMGHGGPDDPIRQINLADFWIYRTKVTNLQYAYCVATGSCTPPSKTDNPGFDDYLRANDPVVGVNWEQAKTYCGWVHARLPTEAEWEKAARGPDANIYPWGNGAPSCDLLNYENCQGKTTPVNKYPLGQSYYQAFDMEGNAFEWVADKYAQDYYLSAPPDNPLGPERGFVRSVRSSAFDSGTNQTQTYNRFHSGPADHRNNLGFRCVVEDPAYFAPYCQFPPIYGTDGVGGAPSGDEIEVSCPDISIVQNPYCDGRYPFTTITCTVTGGPIETIEGCHQESNGTFKCGQAGNPKPHEIFKVCVKCSVTLTMPPKCPDGYTYNAAAKTCIGQGTPGACLPGSTSAMATSGGLCCTFEPGTTAPTINPSTPGGAKNLVTSYHCPAGTWLFWQAGNYECIAVPVQYPDTCKSFVIDFKSCQSHGGGGVGCQITESSCASTCAPLGYIYDAANCSCNCNPG